MVSFFDIRSDLPWKDGGAQALVLCLRITCLPLPGDLPAEMVSLPIFSSLRVNFCNSAVRQTVCTEGKGRRVQCTNGQKPTRGGSCRPLFIGKDTYSLLCNNPFKTRQIIGEVIIQLYVKQFRQFFHPVFSKNLVGIIPDVQKPFLLFCAAKA